ncbi:hypothetical protein H310_00175 [Aphanomyces invadans]|uniref:Uncharacterized protein n=1 Tax=Aphanomyces invadans TaxID=157072 RepID=A0A024UTH4_9STRA|nr:hypothetical protein H310_00175 [Aphanomyces invadans]ETW09659.1 hypothetical protein H310_00175 [Aphanomyces invadans]|eukprot:XP_008861070.1 hypothetical protein H310_00175 [Aphanomyces invadans]
MEDASAAVDEYGLRGIATLPLMEQVHRLLHAISMKYPYKETAAWKTLPLDAKRQILLYIKANKPKTGEHTPSLSFAPPPSDTQDDDYDNEGLLTTDDKGGVEPPPTTSSVDDDGNPQLATAKSTEKAPVAASDPYLAALRTEHSQPVGPPKYQMTWKVKHIPKSVSFKCSCGAVHRTETGNAVLDEVRVMMTTFGDVDTPCNATAAVVQAIVQKQVKSALLKSSLKQYSLLDFTKLFHDEAMYYARWKEFKSNTKDDEDDGGPDDVELSDDLVDELDMFASYESMELNAFQQYFLERMKFADKRTQSMDPSTYLDFSKKRSTNFMAHTKPFLDWLGLPAMSKACIEFLNFVVYNKIGRLVEEAIKLKRQGQLDTLPGALMAADVKAVPLTEAEPSPPLHVNAKKRNRDETLDDKAAAQPPMKRPAPPPARLKRLR